MDTVPTLAELGFDHGSRRQAVVRSVLTDVFQGRIHAGQRLVTEALANRFGVSHTPIREALIELAGIGVIDLLPNRGAIVRRVTHKEVREVCAVRASLECLAIRQACGKTERTTLTELAGEFKQLAAQESDFRPATIERSRRFDSQLHDLIWNSTGNAFLAAELARLKTLFRAYRDVAWEQEQADNDFHRVGVEAREHLAIVEALLIADPKAASQAMARHIRSGVKYWSRITTRLKDQAHP